MGKLLANCKTVFRGGHSRVFSRLNGVGLVSIPLLGTGLGQAVSCYPSMASCPVVASVSLANQPLEYWRASKISSIESQMDPDSRS
jgi:hypothetical protein